MRYEERSFLVYDDGTVIPVDTVSSERNLTPEASVVPGRRQALLLAMAHLDKVIKETEDLLVDLRARKSAQLLELAPWQR